MSSVLYLYIVACVFPLYLVVVTYQSYCCRKDGKVTAFVNVYPNSDVDHLRETPFFVVQLSKSDQVMQCHYNNIYIHDKPSFQITNLIRSAIE